jgi:hypothetical protein
MGRILEGIDNKNKGDEHNAESNYYRVEIAKKLEQDEEEIIWLADGEQSEIERIRSLSIGEYLNLIKYKLRKNG